jgi:osmotically-inducible protein OsmY
VGTFLAAIAHPGPVLAQSVDDALAKRACDAIHAYVHYSIFDAVTASAKNGVVTLEGRVTAPAKRRDLEDRVGRTSGVHQVTNRIEVLPESDLDVDLRRTIAAAIYGHPTFWAYASMSRPPIHIVVEHGAVRLTGTVANAGEQRLAYALAQVRRASRVTNDLRVR